MTGNPASEADGWALVDANRAAIRDFLEWSAVCESRPGWSMRWHARPDIDEAREIIPLFEDAWWAVVVYSCFNSKIGTRVAATEFANPLSAERAQEVFRSLLLPAGAVGMHRIQPGHKGAKRALLAACERSDSFRHILHNGMGFDQRYRRLRALNAASWGRTTCYDLLLRSGALGSAGGITYAPEFAYLGESTGPSAGFAAIWGVTVDATTADQCESQLRWWSANWQAVAAQVGAGGYPKPAYEPADFENALCLYQDELRARLGHGP